jgi:hypothetical protein
MGNAKGQIIIGERGIPRYLLLHQKSSQRYLEFWDEEEVGKTCLAQSRNATKSRNISRKDAKAAKEKRSELGVLGAFARE